MIEDEDWTVEEQAALSSWSAAKPPADFEDQIMDALDAPSRRGGWSVPALAVVGVAAGLLVSFVPRAERLWRPTLQGEVYASARREVRLGHRGVMVAEAGTQASFRVEPSGVAAVRQEAGEVFYRVNPGGPFVVQTPAGTVRVTGTCFRIEVVEMKAVHAGLLGGVLGAAMAGTLVKVSVAEGSVETETAEGRKVLKAGEVAQLGGRPGAPSPARMRGKTEEEPREPSDALAGALAAGSSPVAMKERLTELVERLVALEAEHGELQAAFAEQQQALDKALEEARDDDFIDLDEGTLATMADRCELRFDLVKLSGSRSAMSDREMDRLELSMEERGVADEVFNQHYDWLGSQVRGLYTEVTGDVSTGSLAIHAMINEIIDKVPEPDLQYAFARLSAERAGRPLPPVTGPEAAAIRLYRVLTSAGDRLEQALADRLGPDLAHRYRALEGGWDSRSRGTHGCPGR